MLTKNNISSLCFHISQIFIYLMGGNILIASTLFIFNMTINWWLLPASFVMAVFCCAIFYDGKIDIHFWVEVLISLLLFALLTLFCGSFYDMSWDGNAYHKFAVGLLKHHWNPLTELPYGEVVSSVIANDGSGSIWVEAYAKATWIFGASIYAITNNIESGKVFTLLAMFCAFGFTFSYLQRMGKSICLSTLFSIIVTLNPVAVSQFRTFCVDGYLQLMLYIIGISLFWLASSLVSGNYVISQKVSVSILVSSMILCGNTKFTGLLYGGVFCIAYYMLFCFIVVRKYRANGIKNCIKVGIYFLILALTTIFWSGNSTYYTNLSRHSTLTYPLTGKHPVNVVAEGSAFKTENHFGNLLVSLFSEMDDIRNWREDYSSPKLKIPFSVHGWKEVKRLAADSNSISGFGIFFSGLLMISTLSIIIKLCTMHKNWKFYFLLYAVLLNCTLCFGITASHIARYAPYIFFVFLIGSYIILDAGIVHWKIKLFFSCIFMINTTAFLAGMIPTFINTYNTQKTIAMIRNSDKGIYVDTRFPGHYFNLQDKEISYNIKKDLPDNDSKEMLFLPPKMKLVKWIFADS